MFNHGALFPFVLTSGNRAEGTRRRTVKHVSETISQLKGPPTTHRQMNRAFYAPNVASPRFCGEHGCAGSQGSFHRNSCQGGEEHLALAHSTTFLALKKFIKSKWPSRCRVSRLRWWGKALKQATLGGAAGKPTTHFKHLGALVGSSHAAAAPYHTAEDAHACVVLSVRLRMILFMRSGSVVGWLTGIVVGHKRG